MKLVNTDLEATKRSADATETLQGDGRTVHAYARVWFPSGFSAEAPRHPSQSRENKPLPHAGGLASKATRLTRIKMPSRSPQIPFKIGQKIAETLVAVRTRRRPRKPQFLASMDSSTRDNHSILYTPLCTFMPPPPAPEPFKIYPPIPTYRYRRLSSHEIIRDSIKGWP